MSEREGAVVWSTGKRRCGLGKCRQRGCVQQRLEPGKVKMSESGGRRRLSVFRRCCDNAGPQEALSSHSAGLLPPPLVMLGHLRALRPWWEPRWEPRRGPHGRGPRLGGCGCASEEQTTSAPLCCSWPARNPTEP